MTGNALKIAAVLGAMVCMAILTAVAEKKGVFSSEMAAWLQAIGSIGAVLAAAWFAGKQSAEALAREERDRADRRQAALKAIEEHRLAARTLMESAYIRVRAIADGLASETDRVGAYSIETARSLQRRMAAFAADRLSSSMAMFYFEQAESGLYVFAMHLERRANSIDNSTDASFRKHTLAMIAKEASEEADQLARFLREFDEACKG